MRRKTVVSALMFIALTGSLTNVAVHAKESDQVLAGSAEAQPFQRRLNETIQDRFHLLAKVRLKRDPHLSGALRFYVQDGRITRVIWLRKSKSEAFNQLAIQSVRSLEGDAALLASPSKPFVMTVTFDYPRPDYRY